MKTLKVEEVYPTEYGTASAPRFIDEVYKRKRLHSRTRIVKSVG